MDAKTAENILKAIIANSAGSYSDQQIEEAFSICKLNADLTDLVTQAREKLVDLYVQKDSHPGLRIVYANFINDPDNADLQEVVDRIDLVDENDQPIEAKDKDKYLDVVFQNAQLETEAYLLGDSEFEKKDFLTQRQTFKERLKETFFFDLSRIVLAGKLNKPKGRELDIGTPEYRKYIENQAKKAQDEFNKILNGSDRIKISTDQIWSAVAYTAGQVEDRVAYFLKHAKKVSGEVAKAKLQSLAQVFKTKKDQVETLAMTVSKNRYKIFKEIKGSIKDNAYKIGFNLAANVGMGIGMTASIASGGTIAPALIAYGAYHAASSWIWPVVKNYRKLNRVRKENGEKTLGIKATLKEAWALTTQKGKNRKKYLISASINSVLGVALMGWGAHVSSAASTVKDAADAVNDTANATDTALTAATNVAATRASVRIAKASSATGAQYIDGLVNKEKGTRWGALIGGVFNYFALGLGHSAEAAENVTGARSAVVNPSAVRPALARAAVADSLTARPDSARAAIADSLSLRTDSVGARIAATDSLRTDSIGARIAAADSLAVRPDSAQVAVTDSLAGRPDVPAAANPTGSDNPVAEEVSTSAAAATFPRTYSSEMGISERQYNTLVNTTEGTLGSGNEEHVTLDSMYNRLTDDVMQEHFPGKTREQVMYTFNRLYGFMRKAYEASDGSLRETPSGAEYLESKFTNLNLNLDEETMNELVDFAKENTYEASKTTLKEGLREILPEGTSDHTLSQLITIIHSNQRFCQHHEEMEALLSFFGGCSPQLSEEQGRAINALLNDAPNILKTGTNNTTLTGLNLQGDCDNDAGQWRHVGQAAQKIVHPENVSEEVEEVEEPVNPNQTQQLEVPEAEETEEAPQPGTYELNIDEEEEAPQPGQQELDVEEEPEIVRVGGAGKEQLDDPHHQNPVSEGTASSLTSRAARKYGSVER